MESEVKVLSFPNGEIQRIQLVRPEDWSQLQFLQLVGTEDAVERFAQIYRKYLVPECPWIFGNMVMFRLPEDVEVPMPDAARWGAVADPLTAAAVLLREGVRFSGGGKPTFRSRNAETLYRTLEQRGCLRVVRGKLPVTTPIPVKDVCGYLSEAHRQASLKVNASFFIMDRFDCATVYDHVGTHLGLCVKDGIVSNPPLFDREALLVDGDGRAHIAQPRVEELTLEIRGERYRHGENAAIYSRPRYIRTPRSDRRKLIVIGCRVAAVYAEGAAPVPASGFVLEIPRESRVQPGDTVIYRGMEHIRFGIQVGNSIIRDGEKTHCFHSRFYNIRHLEPVPFPPSLYTVDFRRARAARIALGADAQGKPMLLWAEGAGKNRYVPGRDSRGATLEDMGNICAALGMVNAVNLDGGGSAQILVNGQRALKISDRREGDQAETERPIPFALMIP